MSVEQLMKGEGPKMVKWGGSDRPTTRDVLGLDEECDALALLNDGEVTPELDEMLARLEHNREDLLERLTYAHGARLARRDVHKALARDHREEAARYEKNAESIDDLIRKLMGRRGMKLFEFENGTISYPEKRFVVRPVRGGSGSVEFLPTELRTPQKAPKDKPNKKAIAERIASGKPVDQWERVRSVSHRGGNHG